LPGDVSGVIAGEETDCARQIRRLAETTERNGTAKGIVELVRIARTSL